jgi:tRNA pseudouridine55 synthase
MLRSDKESADPTSLPIPGAPLEGIVVVDKPLGMTSFGVVARVRRRAGGVRTGHAGTLDPLATGVLVLALGKATKSIDRLMATDKRYRTTVDLSAFTTTDDREGERTDVPVDAPPSIERVAEVVRRFVGVIAQRPPAFSAMKVGGRRSYDLARAGSLHEHPARPVRIDAIEIERYAYPELDIDIRCGKGTYIRSLARDIGLALGTGGHCATLRRTAVGPFTEAVAHAIESLGDPLRSDAVIPLATALGMLTDSASPSR